MRGVRIMGVQGEPASAMGVFGSSAAQRPKLRRLAAGAEWIRTSGSAREWLPFESSGVIYLPETVQVLPQDMPTSGTEVSPPLPSCSGSSELRSRDRRPERRDRGFGADRGHVARGPARTRGCRIWAALAAPAAVEPPAYAVTETATKTRMHKAG